MNIPEMVDSPRGATHVAALAAIKRFADAGLSAIHGEHVPLDITQGALRAILMAALDVAGDEAAHDAMSSLRDWRNGTPGRWPVGAPLAINDDG